VDGIWVSGGGVLVLCGWEMWLCEFVVGFHGTIWDTVVRVMFFLLEYYHSKDVACPMALFSGRSKLRFHNMLSSEFPPQLRSCSRHSTAF
jgi:hypothetical protein